MFPRESKITLTSLAFLSSFLMSQVALATTITPETINRPEGQRSYLLALPDQLPTGKHPLIILLHGHTGSAAQLLGQERSAAPMSVWLKIADREGLIIAAPDGAKGSDDKQGWNDCRSDAASNPQTDDVGLVRAIIDREVNEHNADPSRIYIMGMSNGGIMTFRLATELGNKLAGFATVSASMAAISNCPTPKVPVSGLIVSGTADPIVPYTGGDVHLFSKKSRGSVIGVEQTVSIWRKLDGLSTLPATVTELPHLDSQDKTSASRSLWGNDPTHLQVELLRINNGGHIEPSINQRARWFYTKIVGAQNGDVEIAEEAWNFFKDKRVPLN